MGSHAENTRQRTGVGLPHQENKEEDLKVAVSQVDLIEFRQSEHVRSLTNRQRRLQGQWRSIECEPCARHAPRAEYILAKRWET